MKDANLWDWGGVLIPHNAENIVISRTNLPINIQKLIQ